MLERLLDQTLHPPTTAETTKESEPKKPPVRFCSFQFDSENFFFLEKENTNNN
jgi:hypothetical protein